MAQLLAVLYAGAVLGVSLPVAWVMWRLEWE